ncbi:MAG: cysteine hydrolase family protein [Burkholderiaceae bacterium]
MNTQHSHNHPLKPKQTALLIVDLQNDFLAADGAYGRAGQGAESIAALPARVEPLAKAVKVAGGMVLASRFTLWPDAEGGAMISPHLKALRPFLKAGDFAPGSRGQAVVDPLRELVDVCVDKVAYSAFFNTQLEWVLRRAGITTIMVAGIVTQGGVASTVRDAHVRDFHPIVVADGCSSFKQAVHDIALQDMSSIAEVSDCAELLSRFNQAA